MEKKRKLSLTTQLLIASVLGILAGYLLGEHVMYIKFIGDIFLRLVQVVVPILVFCAIVDSVGSLNIKELGSIGIKTVVFFIISTVIAAALGLAVGRIFPTTATLTQFTTAEYSGYMLQGSFIDLIVNFIPTNIVDAFAKGTIVQILVFGVLLGVAISFTKTDTQVERFFDIVKTLNKLMMRIVTMLMVIAPFGIFAILAKTIGTTNTAVLTSLVQYVLMITGANLVFMIAYTLFVAAYLKCNPIQLVRNLSRTIIIGIATGSSAMSVPMEFKDCRERLGLNEKITNFCVPLGMSINTNGAAITTTIACLVCAQLYNMPITFEFMIYVGICAVLATFGNTTVPGGGIVAVAVVFQMVGMPLEAIAIFAGVDYFTGLTRIIVNVVTDVYCGLLVAKGENGIDWDIFNAKNFKEDMGISA